MSLQAQYSERQSQKKSSEIEEDIATKRILIQFLESKEKQSIEKLKDVTRDLSVMDKQLFQEKRKLQQNLSIINSSLLAQKELLRITSRQIAKAKP